MINETSFASDVTSELSLTGNPYGSEVADEVNLTLSAYAEDVAEAVNANPEPIDPPEPPFGEPDLTVCQLNIGHFAMGASNLASWNDSKNDGYPTSLDRNYSIQLNRWKRLVNNLGVDILGLPEWSAIFGTHENYNVPTISSGIFSGYNLSVGKSAAGGWWINSLVSKYQMTSEADRDLAIVSGANQAYARYATIYINEIPVKIVVTHLNWANTQAHVASRAAEIADLVNWLKDEPHVILFGDFNTDGSVLQSASKTEAQFMAGADEFDPFIEAGFTLANHGRWGDLKTCDTTGGRPDHLTAANYGNNDPNTFYNRPFCVLDNIIVKGFRMGNVKVLDTDVFNTPEDPLDIGMITDHCGVICDLTMIE